jgi:hypothetical protein
MKTRIIILTAIILGINVDLYAQKIVYTRVSASAEDSQFRLDLEEYARNASHKLTRSASLDSVAEIRVNYFLDVMQATGNKSGLVDMCNNIPAGRKGHLRYFGNQQFFIEPSGCRYTDPLGILPKKHIKINAEIMENMAWRTSSPYQYTDNKVIEIFTDKIRRSFGDKRYILINYRKSSDHNSAIVNYGDGEYGSCTKMIISRKWDTIGKEWDYEIVLYNLVVFSDPY